MMIETLSGARDLGRLNDIAGVLIRHGFGETVRRLELSDMLERAGHFVHQEHAADLARLSPPENLRRALEELGPAFVKFGQLMAGRADLLSGEWIAELEKLHSQVPALPLAALREQLSADLGGQPEDVFAHFEPEALAGASIAQVHRAQLKDGREVIVKIRRPGIVETVEADLRLLDRLARIAEDQIPALKPYGPVRLVHELARSLRRELDLAAECRNAERIAKNLASLPFVSIPQVHWAYTGTRVNVQDLVQGIPGEALNRLRAEGLDPPLLARRGAQAVLKMIVEDGFFHADPHPGNVFYLPGNRLAFIDFGMVGRLSQRRRDELLQLLLGLVRHEPQDVADVLLDWTANQVRPESPVDLTQLENEIEAFVDQYHGTPLAQLQLGGMLTDVTAILREHHLALPADLALLIKAFISLESMGRGLDPDFHMATEALPLLRQAVRARYQPKALAQSGWQALRRVASMAERLPHDLMDLVRRARRGRLQLHLDLVHLKRVGNQIDRAASRLSMALVIAGLVIGSSIVMTVSGGPTLLGLPAFGLLGFIAATLGGLWLVHSIRAGGRHDDDDG